MSDPRRSGARAGVDRRVVRTMQGAPRDGRGYGSRDADSGWISTINGAGRPGPVRSGRIGTPTIDGRPGDPARTTGRSGPPGLSVSRCRRIGRDEGGRGGLAIEAIPELDQTAERS